MNEAARFTESKKGDLRTGDKIDYSPLVFAFYKDAKVDNLPAGHLGKDVLRACRELRRSNAG